MPCIIKPEYDMLRLSAYTDIMVNPVNCKGVSGKGLALAYKEKWPEMYEAYRQACLDHKLQMGKLHIFHSERTNNTIVNLPTKDHWIDSSNIQDVERGIETLSRYLKENPLKIAAVPMLGTGEGKLDIDPVMALFYKYLHHLPNIIQICIRPDRLEKQPIYVGVGGSRAYTDWDRIELGFLEALLEFGIEKKDITAVVSGGARGVDKVMCGTGLPGDKDPNIATLFGLEPIVIRADWDRYDKAAGAVRNRVVGEVCTHIVAFVGSVSKGTRNLVDFVERYNAKIDEQKQQLLNPTSDYDWFSSSQPNPLPEKKKLYKIDISKVSV